VPLVFSNVSKTFGESCPDGSQVHALKNIDYDIENGRFVSFIGPSGCGKTTLLRLIAGLERPSDGKILLDGREITSPSPDVGLVFQEYALFSWRTVLGNIELGLEISGIGKRDRRKVAMEYVKNFGLTGFEDRYPKELSGGMQQRVAIARAMIVGPKVLLMDEPFGALDSQTRNSLQEYLLGIWERKKRTIVFVTHNIDEAIFLSDKVIVLSRRPGRVKDDFDIKSACQRPRDLTSIPCKEIKSEILGLLNEERDLNDGGSVNGE
jgi:NitT/TauT family transport system ATP-binding protein